MILISLFILAFIIAVLCWIALCLNMKCNAYCDLVQMYVGEVMYLKEHSAFLQKSLDGAYSVDSPQFELTVQMCELLSIIDMELFDMRKRARFSDGETIDRVRGLIDDVQEKIDKATAEIKAQTAQIRADTAEIERKTKEINENE